MKPGYHNTTQKDKYNKTTIQIDTDIKKDNTGETILSNEQHSTIFEIPNQNN